MADLLLCKHSINRQLIDAAHKHQIVVRLKGGDPMIFGKADEEIQAFNQPGIEVETVPSITTSLVGAAAIQQSSTLRAVSRNVAFVTLVQFNKTENTTQQNISQPLQNPNADTLMYYKGRNRITTHCQALTTYREYFRAYS